MFASFVRFGPDGRTLAVSMTDAKNDHRYVALADVASGKVLHEYPGGKQFVSALAYSPDGKLLASANYGSSGIVCLWDARTGKIARAIRSRKTRTVALAFAPDGKTLAIGGSQGDEPPNVIELWDPATGQQCGAFKGDKYDSVYGLAYSPDGTTLAATASDRAVHLWEVATGRPRGRFAGHAGWIRALAWAPDGRALLTGSTDTTALVWDLTGGQRTARPLTDERWQTAWEDLRDADAVKAYRAVWALVAAPQTAAALRERLRPLAPAEVVKIVRWVADLNSERFQVRDRAVTALEKLGRLAEPALRQALEGQPPLEARRRLERLVEKLPPPSLERFRQMRALEALGHSGTPEGWGLLEALAAGAAVDPLTHDALAVLRRLPQRAGGMR